jgi:hypothetical protein
MNNYTNTVNSGLTVLFRVSLHQIMKILAQSCKRFVHQDKYRKNIITALKFAAKGTLERFWIKKLLYPYFYIFGR